LNDAGEDRIRVLIVGDSAIARAGLEAALAEAGRFEIVGSTTSAGVPSLMDATLPDAILLEAHTFSNWTPETAPASAMPTVALTARELEVLRMLADGASNKTIAWKLGISDHTAKFHVASILGKLNAGSRTEAVTVGIRMGLIYL